MMKLILIAVILSVLSGCGAGAGAAAALTAVSELMDADYTEIGVFTTKYDESQKNRTHNLMLAVNAIDGLIVEPGEVFSFNESIGKPTRAKGYKNAKIFVKGKEEQGIGGGICQVSSTLYNAADYAGLEIVERHAHSKKVYYVPEGRDAATAFGSVDLKFKNTLKQPVRIAAWARDGELGAAIDLLD